MYIKEIRLTDFKGFSLVKKNCLIFSRLKTNLKTWSVSFGILSSPFSVTFLNSTRILNNKIFNLKKLDKINNTSSQIIISCLITFQFQKERIIPLLPHKRHISQSPTLLQLNFLQTLQTLPKPKNLLISPQPISQTQLSHKSTTLRDILCSRKRPTISILP